MIDILFELHQVSRDADSSVPVDFEGLLARAKRLRELIVSAEEKNTSTFYPAVACLVRILKEIYLLFLNCVNHTIIKYEIWKNNKAFSYN